MKYTISLLSLWVRRDINFNTVKYALKNKPAAVCGEKRGFVINQF